MNFITKRQVLDAASRGEGPLGKAADDEPVFVLRAQDMLAPDRVRDWARELSKYKGRGDKLADAKELYAAMIAWQGEIVAPHRTKIPD